MRSIVYGFTVLLTIFIIFPSIVAHVPISAQDGESLETAFFIEDPTKSWVIYSELHGDGHPQYFAFEMEAGTRIRMLLSIPVTSGPESFSPSLALMGPGIINSSSIPDFLEIPEQSGVMIIDSGAAVRAYEGFTPTSFYALIDLDMESPETGEYYFAIFDPTNGGPFSVALGYVETFTLYEWLLVPFNVMTIHQWNGQSILSILSPMVVTLIIGFSILFKRRDDFSSLDNGVSWIGVIGALLFFGSGATIFYQITIAALFAIDFQIIVSILFGILPLLLGYFAIRIVLTENWHNDRSKQIRLLLIGIIAPFLWAGLLIGPTLIAISAITPMIVKS